MNRAAKMLFIDELVASVRKTALDNVDRMPPGWDGIELRQYLTDLFQESSELAHRPDLRLRAKQYRNDLLVRNLLGTAVQTPDSCGHVPHRPDAAVTDCEICGAAIANDPETRLWKAVK